ncbi:UNC93-like protein [Episyrphus balteatus]|uniref:UNC93-like protein n=1 Tax=Episyrphus balteatus TaxID=286459 RepID=UPI0024855631|nr:UNC93-like protein [Episyrphus balteatus]XP_055852380.1 UNC93-like protein [Episyrphus balteatus]XP_055852389.1 UNC93-like protein [Episyrphus balteatus]
MTTTNTSVELESASSNHNPNDLNTSSSTQKAAIAERYDKSENFRITKNVVIIGLAFMVHFTAFHGTSNLQSSVNSDAALGTTTLAVIYGSLILSNIFLPVTVIRWFGCKWTIALSFIAYMPYIAAQFYPRFYTFIPAALGVGFGGGPLWCAKCTYLSIVAEAMTRVVGNDSVQDVNVVRFFGLFFVFYQMAQVWGNLISSSVLSFTAAGESNNIVSNFTAASKSRVAELCGANFCPGVDANINPNLIPPESEKIQMLSAIFLCCMVIACLLIIFGVDSLKRYGMDRQEAGKGLSGCKLLSVTIKLLSEHYQILLLPITMFIGLEEAFVAVDFTASFVACGWGISRIGFAMICFGIANAIAAGVAGALAKLVGRLSIMLTVFTIHVCLLIWMLQWQAVEGDYVTYCAMAAIWGICDGIWLVNVNAFTGILFPGKEIAAYSNFRLWESTGSVIGYIISPLLCTSMKLKLLLLVMIVGLLGYGTIEYMERQEKGLVDRRNVELVEQREERKNTTYM